ncbi:hypothetical protein OIU80_17530 [Flavobacterium sp. LS1R47]|jgi:hypothetical protein|uniref:Uncharacterized protein n=1 Tax=Flavobacterium frigoritolerans TaxID=2987686 RepID=A0A9X3HMA4_9FLAO|nr:hypothetical protein [Flavobacterium frigoritolerans]MCV9934086.1 hypothetical protein [Flavobacterium frigoritolerans]
MYWKIELKNTTIAFGLQYAKKENATLFLFKGYLKKQASQIGALTIMRDVTVGIQYANKRIKMLTHQHQIIKERVA